ncbi:DUF3800 domain-containing protein [Phragmitibacter flavus]|uniref:DUF3800 domain-containing protein n=1 Tax=Phragmitibacter flavus TaxID=2576071 RepID=A0A5R8KGW9_9BACT|nr:DUF3800 domain-containing protein [Phragmitibacter flavus]TLD71497.1 DUF3800 domain-containing protein [Phragmitibacter flavus]
MIDHLEQVYWEDVLQPRGEVYENCSFSFLPAKTPTGALVIEEYWLKNQEILQRVNVLIEFDKIGVKYIKNHPIWSITSKPLMLQFIYAAFWRLKTIDAGFGQAKFRDLNIQDRSSGITAHLLITSQVFFDTGTPVILLANYANVHLVDQLDATIKDGDLVTPLNNYNSKIKWLRSISLANPPCISDNFGSGASKTAPEPTSLYIDETGDLGFRKPGHFYAIAGLAIPDQYLRQVREQLKNIINDHWQGPTKPRELHFSKINESKRIAVIAAIGVIFEKFVSYGNCFVTMNFSFLFNLVRAEIEYFRDEERPSRTVIADLLASSDGHVPNRLLMLATEDLISTTIIEGMLDVPFVSVYHDRKRSEWMNGAITDGFNAAMENLKKFALSNEHVDAIPNASFHIIDSEADPCLWLCDWLCWELGGWIRNERKLSAEFLKALQKLNFFTFNEAGERVQFEHPGGKEIRRYPDRAREITPLKGHGSRANTMS